MVAELPCGHYWSEDKAILDLFSVFIDNMPMLGADRMKNMNEL